METILYSISIVIFLYLVIKSILKNGWADLWNTFFIAVLIVTLVITQKYIGKIEGLIISVLPFFTAVQLIKHNKRTQKFYLSKQSKFIVWCDKYLYDLSSKEETKKR